MHRADKYVCEICGTELLSTNGYNKHMRSYLIFNQNLFSNLSMVIILFTENHQSERTEADRKFACKLCPKKFFTRKHLIKHQLVHTNSKCKKSMPLKFVPLNVLSPFFQCSAANFVANRINTAEIYTNTFELILEIKSMNVQSVQSDSNIKLS